MANALPPALKPQPHASEPLAVGLLAAFAGLSLVLLAYNVYVARHMHLAHLARLTPGARKHTSLLSTTRGKLNALQVAGCFFNALNQCYFLLIELGRNLSCDLLVTAGGLVYSLLVACIASVMVHRSTTLLRARQRTAARVGMYCTTALAIGLVALSNAMRTWNAPLVAQGVCAAIWNRPINTAGKGLLAALYFAVLGVFVRPLWQHARRTRAMNAGQGVDATTKRLENMVTGLLVKIALLVAVFAISITLGSLRVLATYLPITVEFSFQNAAMVLASTLALERFGKKRKQRGGGVFRLAGALRSGAGRLGAASAAPGTAGAALPTDVSSDDDDDYASDAGTSATDATLTAGNGANGGAYAAGAKSATGAAGVRSKPMHSVHKLEPRAAGRGPIVRPPPRAAMTGAAGDANVSLDELEMGVMPRAHVHPVPAAAGVARSRSASATSSAMSAASLPAPAPAAEAAPAVDQVARVEMHPAYAAALAAYGLAPPAGMTPAAATLYAAPVSAAAPVTAPAPLWPAPPVFPAPPPPAPAVPRAHLQRQESRASHCASGVWVVHDDGAEEDEATAVEAGRGAGGGMMASGTLVRHGYDCTEVVACDDDDGDVSGEAAWRRGSRLD